MSDKTEDIQVVQAQAMRRFCVAAFKEAQLPQEHAERLTDALIDADLRGVHTHGVMRVPAYVRGYRVGGLNPRPSIKVVKDSGATSVMDGDDGMGLVVSYPAMELAMDKAAEYGVGVVTVRRSNHCGAMAYWSMMALGRDMIGYAATNASPTMAPWGGITLSHGNNPVSYAIPAGKEWPIVLDMAMSVVAKGKIRLAALKGKPIPLGWSMDKNGEPTTDSQVALDGVLVPMGGYKGYGLALVSEVLCGMLSGGRIGTEIPTTSARSGGGSVARGYCHFFIALDIAHFIPVDEFKQRVDTLIHMMKSSKLAKGSQRIYLPGEMEFEARRQRLKEGIPYSKSIIGHLEKVAQDLHIPLGF